MSFLDTLNDAQAKAAKHVEGPMMIIAGAGSGKTRVLTYRIAHLMDLGVDSFNILTLTFTNKAAQEMRQRITSIVGGSESKNITSGTFHSVFSRILRYHADVIGYPSNFTIYDTQDSRNVIKQIVKDYNLDDKVYKPSIVQNRISSAKNNLINAASYAQNLDISQEDKMSQKPHLSQVYREYERRCFKAGAMDFDDLLFKTNLLFKDHPDILRFYQEKFKFILVDEYQDTNFSQYLIVKQLAALFENICVVGDDAQSIYAFRGANIQNILNFKKDYPDCKIYKLEQNYRSSQHIVNAANSVIINNKDQIKKDVWTDNAEGEKINIYRGLTDNDEGKFIAEQIKEGNLVKQLQWQDFAILYRTNAQSRALEEALRKIGISYKIYGGLSFYQRKEIKDLIAYFRVIANHKDEEAIKRIINYPKRGIGKTTIESINVTANTEGVSMWDVTENPEKYNLKINSGAKSKLSAFTTMLKSFESNLFKMDAHDLAKEIAQSTGILKELYNDKSPEGVSRYENIQELLAGMKEFSLSASAEEKDNHLTDFMMDVALLTDADQEKEEDLNKITLMTIHSSKGLEFKNVFLTGMEENLFPSQLSVNSREELEEERRLFYVAITRAESTLTLSYAHSRFKWGNLISNEPSRFLQEIDEKHLNYLIAEPRARSLNNRRNNLPTRNIAPRKLTKINTTSLNESTSDSGDISLKVGYNVEHIRFGKGKVVKLDGSGANQKATIFFPREGQKQILVKFAKLKVLD
jgi:DNA helicase II / ATP-dependent DNA helicase PcrA